MTSGLFWLAETFILFSTKDCQFPVPHVEKALGNILPKTENLYSILFTKTKLFHKIDF